MQGFIILVIIGTEKLIVTEVDRWIEGGNLFSWVLTVLDKVVKKG